MTKGGVSNIIKSKKAKETKLQKKEEKFFPPKSGRVVETNPHERNDREAGRK